MNLRSMIVWAAACSLLSTVAGAQSRDDGWEFGAELIYQNSQEVEFDGGTELSFDSDVGFALIAGFRVNDHLEVHFALDYTQIDYDVTFASGTGINPPLTFEASGEIETITPRVNGTFNFMDGPFTPYVTGGVGYAFIDTNIPDGPPQIGCWWDPWYGEVCTTYQDTQTTESFTYNAGVGIRWDINDGWSTRLAYEKHWFDTDHADTLDFDQIKLGFLLRY